MAFPYDESLFESIDPMIEPAIYGFLALGVLLAIVAVWYRQVASVFFFYSCAKLLLMSFVPSE